VSSAGESRARPPATEEVGRAACDLGTLAAEIEAEVARLAAEGHWDASRDADLAERFELAAAAALRVPRLAERSRALRRVARLLVPAPARPVLRAGLARVEGAAARIARWRSRRDR
jgi:hypothetical protein